MEDLKKGDKVIYTRTLMFGKGEVKEKCTIVAVTKKKILLDNGVTLWKY